MPFFLWKNVELFTVSLWVGKSFSRYDIHSWNRHMHTPLLTLREGRGRRHLIPPQSHPAEGQQETSGTENSPMCRNLIWTHMKHPSPASSYFLSLLVKSQLTSFSLGWEEKSWCLHSLNVLQGLRPFRRNRWQRMRAKGTAGLASSSFIALKNSTSA